MKTVPVYRGVEKIAPFYALWADKAYFAGGFVRWMCSPAFEPAPAGDLDIWPKSDDFCTEIVKDLEKLTGGTVQRINGGPGQIVDFANLDVAEPVKKGPATIHESPLAYTTVIHGQRIQVIKPRKEGRIVSSGTLEQIIDGFDFTCIRIGLNDLHSAQADDDFVQDEMRKRLVIKKIHCPIAMIKRLAKYVNKGYRVSPTETFKLFIEWDARSPDFKAEMHDLMNQLVEAENWWALDVETRERIQEILYVD